MEFCKKTATNALAFIVGMIVMIAAAYTFSWIGTIASYEKGLSNGFELGTIEGEARGYQRGYQSGLLEGWQFRAGSDFSKEKLLEDAENFGNPNNSGDL